MIDREGQLEPIERKPVFWRHHPGIVDQKIEPVIGGEDSSARRRTWLRLEKSASAIVTRSEQDPSITKRRAASVRSRSRETMTTRIPVRARPSAVWRPIP